MQSHNIKKKLNVFEVPINGINLIEASAGTGKTFTIVVLYIRLLLGIENKTKYCKKLSVQEILVVTFTNAAKEELYVRIKKRIENLYLACLNKAYQDSFSMLFLKKIKNINEAIQILKKAQNDINNASIYTIHSFCQNILRSYTFHLHSIFENKILEDENDLYLQATQDFWRSHFYNLPEDIIKIIYKNYKNPECFLKKIKPFFHIKFMHVKKKFLNKNILIIYHNKNIKKIKKFKTIWLMHYKIMLKKIDILKINKRIYSKFHVNKWIHDITEWSKSETHDYQIPSVLKYFTQKYIEKNTLNNICLKYILFEETQKILKHNFSLKNIFILYAIKKIKYFLIKEKKRKSILGFNDLISMLLKTIKKEKHLNQIIKEKYPIAFIDEFQDTDIEQYQIFNHIYKNDKEIALFLIGDPKQAIYSFRGADIFSYLYAKNKIKKHYYLDINWRSSYHMCNSINILFNQMQYPFILKNILFNPIISAQENSKMHFTINGKPQFPITFFFQNETEVSINDYQIWISKKCADEISYWITCSKKGQAIIKIKNQKNLESNDIAVLVRNQKEANLIEKELKKRNISSVYSSQKNNIFHTFDAQELLWILQSVLEPENEILLQQSISTHLLQTILHLSQKKIKNNPFYEVIEKLYEYQTIWKNIGIFYMIKTMILQYQTYSDPYLLSINYEKNLNFLHIAELLEEKSFCINKKNSLIRWLQNKIIDKKQSSYKENIRSFNEDPSVKIITIHKSKGLEYPIVWIPFGIDFNESKLSLYHNKKDFLLYFDIEEKNKNKIISDEERLAEDIRFLYVAITRSILHCSIGIASLTKKKIKNKENSDIHKSALGYIVQNRHPMNYKNLLNQLKKLSISKLIEVKQNINNFSLPVEKRNIYLIPQPNIFNKNTKTQWKITSFTQLSQENTLSIKNKKITILKNLFNKKEKKNNTLTIHNFPRGKNTGLLMHHILKNLHFLDQKNEDWFSSILNYYNISLKWTEMLISWIKNIINTPLNNENIILSQIKKELCVKELEFFIPIKELNNLKLNKIIQSIDPISNISPKLSFHPVKGMINGFIDLFFFWKKKYYIIDYKSNWLGINNNFYSDSHITEEIIKKRYDLQYQIYTMAIHKYLKNKVKNYNYKDDFGGIFYIFLRAIDKKSKNNGIFYIVPDHSLIKKMILITL